LGFYLFGAFIPYYGFCIASGIVCAASVSFLLCRRFSLNFDYCIVLCAYFLLFGFLGAKLLYIAISFKTIDFNLAFHDSVYFNYLVSSGFVFYGGLAGGLFAVWFAKKIHHIETEKYIQILCIPASLAHAFGRIGCFLSGCCHGKATESCFSIIYTHSLIAPNGIKLIPVQLIEAVFLFMLAIILLILLLKEFNADLPDIYILSYSIFRFIIEFFRGDKGRGFIGSFSTSQVISIFFTIYATFFLLLHMRKSTNTKNRSPHSS